MKNRKITTAAIAASLLGGAAFGSFVAPPMAALAADSSTSTTATATARTPGQWVTDTLKGLVDKGTITQAQSDAVATALKDAQPKGRPDFGRGGRGPGLAKVAEVLGMSETDLHAALEGKSFADVAKDKNVDIQKVIDALVAADNERIDKEVTDGHLTPAQADARKAKTVERVTTMVNNVRLGKGHDGGRPGKGFGGPRGDAPDGEAAL